MRAAARVPVSEPWLTSAETAAVTDAVQSGWISSAGRYLDAFEEKWAAYCGRRHGIAVSNGTTALELSVEALGIEPGDEVIMPTFTIISCALAVVRAGGIPVLVDADAETWCMNVSEVEAKITPRTRAIMPVHIYGHPCDMDPLLALADRYGIDIIEDAAEAHGAEYDSQRGAASAWQRCGSFGDLSTFSFYANKLITTGEGGMVLTNDNALASKLRAGRNLNFQASRRFYHTELGHQFRLTNLQAALGVSQVGRMPELLARKRWMGAAYSERFAGMDALALPVTRPWARSMFWMYGVVLRDTVPFDAAELARRLDAQGIETRPFFLGMHEQPALHDRGLFASERYLVAERIARRGLYLPSGLGLTEIQLERVADAVKEILA